MSKGTHPCFVNGCKNLGGSKENPISLFRFPAVISHKGEKMLELSTKRRTAWLAAVNRQKQPTQNSRVCQDHFINKRPAPMLLTSHPDWVPSLRLSETSGQDDGHDSNKKMERYIYNNSLI